jgi:hypothetical protein
MNICIVGEGPVGLVTSLLFSHFKNKYNIDNLNIVLYKSRRSFDRRHVININKNLVKEIEKLIASCNSCLSGDSSVEIEEEIMSINCLETILYQNIDKKIIQIMENTQFNEDEQLTNHYNHIFLCDGYNSKNRSYFIYNSINYSPTKCIFFDNAILTLYTNLTPLGSPVSDDCIDNHSEKKMFNTSEIVDFGIDFNRLIALISIVYNINLRIDSLPVKPDITIIKKNLWVSGFIDFNDFNNLFTNTIKYLIETPDNKVIFDVFRTHDVSISYNTKYLLENKIEMNNIFSKYSDFIKTELIKKESQDKPFMVHSITPNCTSYGIILDDNESKLLYCKKIAEKEYAWLVGDSANGYPGGYGLSNGIKDAFYLVKQFLKTNILTLNTNISEVPIEFTTFSYDIPELFSCDSLNKRYLSNLLTSRIVCDYVKNLKFVGGYNNSLQNDNLKTISYIMSIINSKTCAENDDLLDLYNLYQVNNFFNNIVLIFCKEVSGGNIKKNKYKNKSKSNKFKGINKTKKNMKKGRSKRKYPKGIKTKHIKISNVRAKTLGGKKTRTGKLTSKT